jgi:hypothetical protein
MAQAKTEEEKTLASAHVRIVSENNFPTAAGLASSASGYACLGECHFVSRSRVLRRFSRHPLCDCYSFAIDGKPRVASLLSFLTTLLLFASRSVHARAAVQRGHYRALGIGAHWFGVCMP